MTDSESVSVPLAGESTLSIPISLANNTNAGYGSTSTSPVPLGSNQSLKRVDELPPPSHEISSLP